MSNVLTHKDPLEEIVMTFDFTPALEDDETIHRVEQISVEVSAGIDPAPQKILTKFPVVSKDGKAVLQPIIGGLDQVNYNVKCVAQTSNPEKTLAVTGILPVRHQ